MERETLGLRDGLPRPGALRLVVLDAAGPSTYTLPATGQVVIGRGSGADIRVDEASISRKHAVLHLGPPLRLEDLGSANGTRVRDRALQPGESIELVPGDSIELGTVLLVVQRETPQQKPVRLHTHDYFEARLEDECERAGRAGTRFGVARLHVGAAPQEALLSALAASSSIGTVAWPGPGVGVADRFASPRAFKRMVRRFTPQRSGAPPAN